MLIDKLHQEAHVWFTTPESAQDGEILQRLKTVLSSEELDRHRRFHFPADRHRYLVSHALLRETLSTYTNIPPADWCFSHGKHGRPEIANPGTPPLRFNLTHTDGMVCCIVTLDDDCGIDVEKISARHNPVAVAARMFSPAEHAELTRLQGSEQLEYFYSRWTLREAYVKARGIGLSFPTCKLRFRIRNEKDIDIEFDESIDDDKKNWMVNLWRPGPEHIAAIAIARQADVRKQLIVRQLEF
jgi:4'-phosphopantetheinyl transferase